MRAADRTRPSAPTPRCRAIFSPQIASRLALDGRHRHGGPSSRDRDDLHRYTGFTSLVETTTPEMLGELLNEYMGGMTEIVFAHEGTVAKIIGDSIQVLFNAPGDQPDHARRGGRLRA